VSARGGGSADGVIEIEDSKPEPYNWPRMDPQLRVTVNERGSTWVTLPKRPNWKRRAALKLFFSMSHDERVRNIAPDVL